MSILSFFGLGQAFANRGSASAARQRLSALLVHDRAARDSDQSIEMMEAEIARVILRYAGVDREQINFRLMRGQDYSTLDVHVRLPGAADLNSQLGRSFQLSMAAQAG